MSDVHAYLEVKAQTPKEWVRRDPRVTHPAILALVRECTAYHGSGGVLYDDVLERYVNERVGDLPAHLHHGHPDRHPLVNQLGHEVYIAKGSLEDEKSTAVIMQALDDGYVPLADAELVDGARYLVRIGTLYSGYAVACYGSAREVRAKLDGARFVFLPKGARTHGFAASGLVLVKVVTR